MLKRKILAAVLPVVAAGTVVGSGFSAWYFGSLTGDSGSGKIGVSITDGAEFGSLTAYYTLVEDGGVTQHTFDLNGQQTGIIIQLDQGGTSNAADTTKGISFLDSSKKLIKTIGFKYEIKDFDSFVASDYTFTVNFSVEIVGKLANYVQFATSNSDPSKPDNNFSTSIGNFEFDESSNNKILCTLNNIGGINDWVYDVSTGEDLANSMLQYKKDMKPTEKDVYESMVSTITNDVTSCLSFSVNVSIQEA